MLQSLLLPTLAFGIIIGAISSFLKVGSTATKSCLEAIRARPIGPGITGARSKDFCRAERDINSIYTAGG